MPDCNTCRDSGYVPVFGPGSIEEACPEGCFLCEACGVTTDDKSFQPLCTECGNAEPYGGDEDE